MTVESAKRTHVLRFRIFTLLTEQPDLTQAQLARRLRVPQSTISTQIYRMGLDLETLRRVLQPVCRTCGGSGRAPLRRRRR